MNDEHQPKFSDPVDETGRSRLWLPALAVMFLFLIGVAALMLVASLMRDSQAPQAPAAFPDPPAEVAPAP